MRVRGVMAVALWGCLSVSAWAVTPRFWENFTPEEMLAGTLDRVTLAPEGALALAPAYERLFATGESYIFAAVRDRKGNVYVGTGAAGRIFRIDPQGHGAIWFQAEELHVFALALDDADALYAATAPDGRIYRITGASQYEEFCRLDAKYIWALAFDAAGNLYAGTGGSGGVIYKIDKTGAATAFYNSGESHVRSLLSRGKNLVAGTAPGGKIVEITPEGRAFALADTPLEEINALTEGRDGVIYAAAASTSAAATAALAPPAPAPQAHGASIVVEVIADSPPAATTPARTMPAASPALSMAGTAARSTVYAIGRAGDVEVLFDATGQVVYDLAALPDGSLLLATGPKGRLLRVDGDGRVTYLTDSPEEDVTRLLVAGNDIYTATSNQGQVYRLRLDDAAPRGSYVSQVLDAGAVASWGRLFWRYTGTARLAVATRSGNTATPDGSWSAWSEPCSAPGAAIASPRARYLQWRAVFAAAATTDKKKRPGTNAAPAPQGNAAATASRPNARLSEYTTERLDQVRIAYLQQNLRPRITELSILAPGIELQAQPAMSGTGIVTPLAGGRTLLAPRERGRDALILDPRQMLTPGAQSFTWKATDDNGDALAYSLYFRGENEADWKLLASDSADTFYTLNTAALPDGSYRLKVVVSDEPSNPPELALTGEKISAVFVVAAATPRVEITASAAVGRTATLAFRAVAAGGNIAAAEYSIDGGAWRLIFPVDGIADSATEEYRLLTPELAAGEHLIAVRAGDRNGMTATAGVMVRIP